MKNDRILVSIPSYRDSEVIPTVESLISKCSKPSRLRVIIFNQGNSEDFDLVNRFLNSTDIDILHVEVDARDARGAGWARAEIQSYYDGEEYYLHLDSHIQFSDNWDILLDTDLKAGELLSEKVVLTAYLPGYEFQSGQRVVPTKSPTNFELNTTHGLVGAVGRNVPEGLFPQRCYFFSGHFAYAHGEYIKDVPYDPEIFFFGEEISQAIRSECAGYTLYCPSKYVAAHLYNRSEFNRERRRLVWDNSEDQDRDLKWWQRDVMSKHKVRAICHGEWFGNYGIKDPKRYDVYKRTLWNLYGIDLRLT